MSLLPGFLATVVFLELKHCRERVREKRGEWGYSELN